ncbi:hypothetical protein C4K04_4681 [Pseudomonas chlororaphis]|uniref:Transposase n=1 Tax=Pseudomonas chlororaphis TaxID=587753 RepID=A0A3G7TVN1_9PSED|nr:hypothetical protein C4K04_4681 [Pseudomonas chlororaphis]
MHSPDWINLHESLHCSRNRYSSCHINFKFFEWAHRPPLNLSMADVSRREGVSEMSLSYWRKQVSSEGNAV